MDASHTARRRGAAFAVALGGLVAGAGPLLAQTLPDQTLPTEPQAVTAEPAAPAPRAAMPAAAPDVQATAPATTPDPAPAAASPSPEPKAAASVVPAPAVAPPTPPEAPVVIQPADVASTSLSARLADATVPLGPRITRKDREAMTAFYALGAFKPVWVADGAWTAPARALMATLKRADADGLDPADYAVAPLGPSASATDLAAAELSLSATALRYAKDARGARIDLQKISRLITPKLELPEADALLSRLASAGAEAGTVLQAYNPGQPGYRALKAKLAEMRAGRKVDDVPMVDLAVPTGGRAKLAGLAAPRPAVPESEILANMERWRWLPTDLGRDYVMVNIPEYRVRVVEAGRVVHEARVVVGKPDTPTPLFSGTMEYAVVNPSWNVPPSILKNEFLPGLARDPDYAARRGYEVVRRGNSISVRQPPGERNALGFIKFMFPNQHAVYLHDTPSRSLFASARRAFSHGCVRVDQPFEFAQYVLGSKWPPERLKKLIGRGERTIQLPEKLPVHLAYFTATVDDTGTLRTLPDVYGIDQRVRIALGLEHGSLAAPRPVAVAPPRPKRAVHQAARPIPRAAQITEAPPAAPRPNGGFFDSFWR